MMKPMTSNRSHEMQSVWLALAAAVTPACTGEIDSSAGEFESSANGLCAAVCDCVCGASANSECVRACESDCEASETIDECMALHEGRACIAQCEAAFGAIDPEPTVPPTGYPKRCEIGEECDPCNAPLDLHPDGGTIRAATSGAGAHGAWCGGFYSPEDVYAWTPRLSGTSTLTTCGSSFDTVLYVRAGSCLAFDVAACNDEGCPSGHASEITLYVTAGTTYYIFVDGAGSQSGDYVLDVSDPRRMGDSDTCEPAECGGSGGSCFCDADCDTFGDCCENACAVCGDCQP